jgi:hypothetical protein
VAEGFAVRHDTIPVDELDIRVPALRVPGLADRITARPTDSGDDGGRGSMSVLDAARTIRRLLLIGGGGSGKTFALQQVAARCSTHSDGPTPVPVPLKRLAERLPPERQTPVTVEELVEVATAPGAAAALRQALVRQVTAGRAVLLLDGLDECGAARDKVVSALAGVLADVHPDVDVVVASRHSAAAAAGALGLVSFEIQRPSDFDSTAEKLLEHIGEHLLGDHDRPGWLERVRANPADQRGGRGTDPWRVPLFAVLGALCCSTASLLP